MSQERTRARAQPVLAHEQSSSGEAFERIGPETIIGEVGFPLASDCMKPCAGLFLVGVALIVPPSTSAQPRIPAAIYKALATTPIPAAQLPSGLQVTSVARESLTQMMKEHHAVGSVGINFGVLHYLQYTVFPTHQDAVSQYQAEIAADDAKAVSYAPARALNVQAQIVNLLFGFGGKTNGLSGVVFVYGDVVAKAEALSNATTSKKSPFGVLAPEAVKIAICGFKHVASVLSHY